MKQRLFSLLLALSLLSGLFPSAFAQARLHEGTLPTQTTHISEAADSDMDATENATIGSAAVQACVTMNGITTHYDTLEDAILAVNLTPIPVGVSMQQRAEQVVITLLGDVTLDESTNTIGGDTQASKQLTVEKPMTLDLNGFDIQQIDANNRAAINLSGVGFLILRDSTQQSADARTRYGYWDVSGLYRLDGTAQTNGANALKGGIISGGRLGAITVSGASRTFLMESGTLAGNIGLTGSSAVSVGQGTTLPGTFIMNGGTITGNAAKSSFGAGAVYAANGTFTMNGGTITGNRAKTFGGIWASTSADVTLTGGRIYGNIATNTALAGAEFLSHRASFGRTLP